MSVLLSSALSLASRPASEHERRSAGSPRVATAGGDVHSIFNVSVYHIHQACIPPYLPGVLPESVTRKSIGDREVESPRIGRSDTKRPARLFPVTHAEKCQLTACNPALFSNLDYLKLIIGVPNRKTYLTHSQFYSHKRDKTNTTIKGEVAKVHPLMAEDKTPPALATSQDLTHHSAKRTSFLSPVVRKGVEFHDIRQFLLSESIAAVATRELIEMGDPISPLNRALMGVRAAGYENHDPVILGPESQPMGLQFTRFEGGYDRINVPHAWFRACFTFGDTVEIPSNTVAGSVFWEFALQNACNKQYNNYIVNTCKFGAPLPPRLDLRPLELKERCLRYEAFIVPDHEWSVESGQLELEDLDGSWIRGGYCMDGSSLRHEVDLGEYQPDHDPHKYILFKPAAEVDERWRVTNFTEQGTLYRKSRVDAQPTEYKVKGLDLPWLFRMSRCRRYFPRLRFVPTKD